MAKHRFFIDLPVRNQWDNVELIRTAILNCFNAVFREIDRSHAISTVISELLENAIKYGNWQHKHPEPPPALRLGISGDHSAVVVTVEHPVDPQSPSVATLMKTLEWLKSFSNPQEAYEAKLRELADNRDGDGLSQLGLARIAYEGACSLQAEIVDGNALRLTGEMTL